MLLDSVVTILHRRSSSNRHANKATPDLERRRDHSVWNRRGSQERRDLLSSLYRRPAESRPMTLPIPALVQKNIRTCRGDRPCRSAAHPKRSDTSNQSSGSSPKDRAGRSENLNASGRPGPQEIPGLFSHLLPRRRGSPSRCPGSDQHHVTPKSRLIASITRDGGNHLPHDRSHRTHRALPRGA